MKTIDYIHLCKGDIDLVVYREILKSEQIKKQRKKNFINSLLWLLTLLVLTVLTSRDTFTVYSAFIPLVIFIIGKYYEELSKPIVVDCR